MAFSWHLHYPTFMLPFTLILIKFLKTFFADEKTLQVKTVKASFFSDIITFVVFTTIIVCCCCFVVTCKVSFSVLDSERWKKICENVEWNQNSCTNEHISYSFYLTHVRIFVVAFGLSLSLRKLSVVKMMERGGGEESEHEAPSE